MLLLQTKIISAGLQAKLPDCTDVDVNQVAKLFERLELSPDSTEKRNNRTIDLLMAVATMFGLDEGNDELRYRKVLQDFVPRILQLEDDQLLAEIKYAAQQLMNSAFTASGAHRFYPLVWTVFNSSLFPCMDKKIYEQARKYLFGHSPAAGIENLPFLTLKLDTKTISDRRRNRELVTWLDIGSAFKNEGAPTLNMLKNAFPQLEVYGDDISFPYFQISVAGNIQHSEYIDNAAFAKTLKGAVDAPDTPFKPAGQINRVRYLNGKYDQYNVFSDNFLSRDRFDFISLCMTFHHLHTEPDHTPKNPQKRFLTLTNKTIVAEAGQELTTAQKTMFLYPSQQKVFERLLERLEIGGLFFFNMFELGDAFYIFQRTGQTAYKLYDRHPVLFSPNDDRYSPSEYFGLINGNAAHTVFRKVYRSLQKILNLTAEEAAALQEWLTAADKLNTYYQQWPSNFTSHGQSPTQVWFSVEQALNTLLDWQEHPEKLDLQKFFTNYLIESVPKEIKTALLNAEIIRRILEKIHNS